MRRADLTRRIAALERSRPSPPPATLDHRAAHAGLMAMNGGRIDRAGATVGRMLRAIAAGRGDEELEAVRAEFPPTPPKVYPYPVRP